jgi:hypothetical protein
MIDDGTMCRMVSCLPGPTREINRVASLSATDKLLEAMRRAAPLLPAGMRDEFLGLLSPTNLAVTAAVLAVWAGSHAFGVGEVVDVLVLIAGGFFLGWSAFSAAADLVQFVRVGAEAKAEADLDVAARHLARFVSVVGVATFVAVVMKVGGKAVPRRLSGLVEKEGGDPIGAGGGAPAEGPWWEVTDRDTVPDHPGTSVPQRFTLKVAGREFAVKGTYDPARGPLGATKHMQEYAARYGTAGARAGQVDYPISPLAGALEEVVESGDLVPLLRGQVKRLGTEEAPYVKGGWEFSFEFNNGRVEVFHAVPKRK